LDPTLSLYGFDEGDTRRIEYDKQSQIPDNQNKNLLNNHRIDYKTTQQEQEQALNFELLTRKSVQNTHIGQNFSTISPNLDESTETQIDDIREVSEQLNNRLIKEDLQNPVFEEAIAAIIDENGGIHLHDGPGGLYGIVPPDTVSDHHVNVFSRPAIQDNMVFIEIFYIDFAFDFVNFIKVFSYGLKTCKEQLI